MSRHHRRRWLGAAVTVGVLIGILGPGATGVLAKPPAHCVTPTGVDLNVVYGVSAAIVAPFCTEIDAGHRWTVTNAWFMSPTFDFVPPGFVPAGATRRGLRRQVRGGEVRRRSRTQGKDVRVHERRGSGHSGAPAPKRNLRRQPDQRSDQ